MGKIFEVRSLSRSGEVHGWGACHSRAEAERLLIERSKGPREEWAKRYHQRWWIEEIDNTGMFIIPPLPMPREQYSTKVSEVETPEGTWNTLHVDIIDDSGRAVASYDRNHSNLYRTFEPFRQGDRTFALISPDYTATSVIDLSSGAIVAAEKPSATGFCPAGFYVPDWWDVHDGSVLPGSMDWDADLEAPVGDFGFVWGCVWGDDSSWKVQYLDLSEVQRGKIRREERFGYLELAVNLELNASEFIQCSFYQGRPSVTFSTPVSYDLETGAKERADTE